MQPISINLVSVCVSMLFRAGHVNKANVGDPQTELQPHDPKSYLL